MVINLKVITAVSIVFMTLFLIQNTQEIKENAL